VIASDPSAPDFSVRDLQLARGVDANRLEDRRSLIRSLDRYQQSAEVAANARAGATSTYYQKAFELVTSPRPSKRLTLRRRTRSFATNTAATAWARVASWLAAW